MVVARADLKSEVSVEFSYRIEIVDGMDNVIEAASQN